MIPYSPSNHTAKAILAFYTQCYAQATQNYNIRERARIADLVYQRETDWTEESFKAAMANYKGDANKFRNITMPVVMPKIESAVSYQQSVFLQGYPIFSVATVPEFADAATQMDTIIGEQQIYAGWVPELLKVIRNAFKYNLAPVEVSWDRDVSYSYNTNRDTGREQQEQQVIWEGNKVRALSIYNTFWDTRVEPTKVHSEGEYAGYIETMSRMKFKQFLAKLPEKINVKEALESGRGATVSLGSKGLDAYSVPQINPFSLVDFDDFESMNWEAWAGLESNGDPKIRYANAYQVTTLYARILPEDFKMTSVPGRNTPQVWRFIVVNDQVVIHCERMTNEHNFLPIIIGQAMEDGLGYQTKSMSEDMTPFQQITTALSNSTIAARRRAISDRILYDPSRVSAASVNSDNPNARIPVRPSAFGTPLSESVYPFPFRDDQFQFNINEIQFYQGVANDTAGLNPARQGQFVKGNKTRFEYADVMQNASGRDQMVALMLEGNLFGPIKRIIKSNILQYQGGARLYNREADTMVQVEPDKLRKAVLEFKLADGLNPNDKLIDGESLAMAMQTLASSPQLGAGYNLAPMFSYLMKQRGAKLQPFEKSQEQMAYEQAMMQWQQAMAGLAEQLGSTEMSPQQIQQLLQQMPQPTPEQFGYDPQKTGVSVQFQSQTVMGRVTAAMQSAQSSGSGSQAGGASQATNSTNNTGGQQ